MPSQRRLRVFMLAILAIVITTLFFTSKMRRETPEDTRTLQDFYHKTMNAMDHQGDGSQAVIGGQGSTVLEPHIKDKDGDGTVDDDDVQLAKEMADRLRAAEVKAKELANAKAPKPNPPSEVIGVGSAAGAKDQPKVEVLGSKLKSQNIDDDAEDADEIDSADHEVEFLLAQILKKSPVVIFSKSYCPYSKRAKGILLEKYQIEPTPFVVELDQEIMGPELQAKLASMTGRRTVPNILINGKSVGGSDEIAGMDKQDVLIDTFKQMGGKRVMIEERFADED